MRKRAVLLLVLFLLTGMLAYAETENTEEAVFLPYCGTWFNGDMVLEMQLEDGCLTDLSENIFRLRRR